MSSKGMTPKQERFVQEYLIDLNATQAAIRAGYKEKTANEQGARLLTKVSIKQAVNVALEERAARIEITQDKVIKELARVAFADPRKIFIWGPGGVILRDSNDLTDDEAAAVSEVSETTTENGGTVKAKLLDKLKALELLGKHLGMFNKLEVKNEISGRVTVASDPYEELTTEELRKLARLADE